MNFRGTFRPRIAEAVVVALLLGLHAWMAISSGRAKSATFDEIAHFGGGYLQRATGDYRFNAESGTLPQRWAAWPLPVHQLGVPPADHPARHGANVWVLGRELLYGGDRDHQALLQAGRTMIVLFSLALATLVYAWSRAWYGPAGGLLSLGLYSLSPTMLAHARLITADMAAAFFFLLATGAMWRLLQRVTPLRFTVAALAVSGLLLSKMSGLLILPIAAILSLWRLSRRQPLELSWGAWRSGRSVHEIASRGRQALVIAALAIGVTVVAFGAVWSAYGWRYSAQPPPSGAGATGADPAEASSFLHSFESQLERGGLTALVLGVARGARLLPEAYLWGLAYTLDTTRERDAFLRGHTRQTGWWWFFPYAVAIKTPLALFGLLALAAAAIRRAGDAPSNQDARGAPSNQSLAKGSTPLWVLLAVYSLVAAGSHLNIGHRHMLPIYPVLFIFVGMTSRWLSQRHRLASLCVLLCLGSFAWESKKIRPHYLSYFNQLVGGPEHGYRHLVDSSLDWGQDLPGLASFLTQLRAPGTPDSQAPVYAAYFGAAPPANHGIDAHWLYSFFPVANRSPAPQPLTGGVYCVSATLLQSMHIELPGPWNVEREQAYRQQRRQVERLLAGGVPLGQQNPQQSAQVLRSYDRLRSARLFAFLRQRQPDARIGYSIHIYRLSEADIEQALNGPLLE